MVDFGRFWYIIGKMIKQIIIDVENLTLTEQALLMDRLRDYARDILDKGTDLQIYIKPKKKMKKYAVENLTNGEKLLYEKK